MEALPLAVTTGWASGVNAYACVLILGLLGRFAGAGDVPHALTTTPVLIPARALAAFHPEAALIIAAILLVIGLIAVYFASRFIRRGYLRFKAWREKRGNGSG